MYLNIEHIKHYFITKQLKLTITFLPHCYYDLFGLGKHRSLEENRSFLFLSPYL